MQRLDHFSGESKPSWSPEAHIKLGSFKKTKNYLRPAGLPDGFKEFFYVADNFLDRTSCENLIAEFATQSAAPVGVSGYSNIANNEIGSFRTNAWATSLAEKLGHGIKSLLSDEIHFRPEINPSEAIFQNTQGERLRMPVDKHNYTFLGATPFMRFMKYPTGGRHVPHYDAPYVNTKEQYITLMSWVLYLNTPEGTGGEFQFIDDRQWDKSPLEKNKADWDRMAKDSEVLASVKPTEGCLLVLPHWLAHQVSLYSGPSDSWRYIIRGDVAYGYHRD